MSDFCRMLSIYKFGGIWADIGDTVSENFAIVWEKYGLDSMAGAGLGRDESQRNRKKSFTAPFRCTHSSSYYSCLQRMRKLWRHDV